MTRNLAGGPRGKAFDLECTLASTVTFKLHGYLRHATVRPNEILQCSLEFSKDKVGR